MHEEGTRNLWIDTTPEALYAAITDFPSYPAWTGSVRKAEVLERDENGRGRRVAYTAGAVGITATYTLEYEFDEPTKLSWRLIEGKIKGAFLTATIKALDGYYLFESVGSGGTNATYKISADLSIPLGPFRSTAERVVMDSALRELKRYVES